MCGAVDTVPEEALEVAAEIPPDVESPPDPESWRRGDRHVVLASRGDRLLARLIDGGLAFLVSLVTMGMVFGFAALVDRNAAFAVGVVFFLVVFGGQLVLWVVQAYYLSADGQSLGKKAMKIKIVMLEDYRNGGIVPNFLLRELVNGLICIVPFYGLVDILLIFADDRRCIHDHIAGTIVVNCDQR